jgi:predicted nucleotidyltransferase
LGAGIVLDALSGEFSPEAEAARSTFRAVGADLSRLIRDCISGRELVDLGYWDDVGLAVIYRECLHGIYPCGSYACGQEESDSNLDVLVVLDTIDNIEHYGAEVGRTGYLVSALSLKYCLSISRVFVSQQEWGCYESPFLANVREEAISV